jgi:hypothetical protein
MDFWSHKGRPKLIAALEAACDAVQDDFAAGALNFGNSSIGRGN